MISKEKIRKALVNILNEVTDVKDVGEDTILVSENVGIFPADFIYIFDALERELSLPVFKIFENSNYSVMTVKNLTEAIYKLGI